jgi:hypothetical protein
MSLQFKSSPHAGERIVAPGGVGRPRAPSGSIIVKLTHAGLMLLKDA